MDNINIMVLDDDRVSQIYLGELINSILPQAHICKVDSGEKALDILKEKTFHYIFSDIMMPALSGTSLFVQLKKAAMPMPGCKLIAVSSITDSEKVNQIVGGGIEAVLCKPVEKQTLLKLFKGESSMDKGQKKNLCPPDTILNIGLIVNLYNGNRSKISSILKMYAENLPEQFHKLKRNVDSQSPELLHANVHSIKNSFSYLGHVKLMNLAKSIEDKLLTGKIDDSVRQNVHIILSHKELVISAINALIAYYEND